MRIPDLVCAILALVLSAGMVQGAAEEPAPRHEFSDIVVTATRTERNAVDIPAATTVVTQERLKDLRLFGPKEALQGIAGVQAETRNDGYDARLIIRGAGLKARYGVREIMVLLDGVPITDPDGMTRLDFVDTQLIESIDVVRGPNSTLYGANAAGGVVNILTKDPFEERKSLRLGVGENDTQLFSALYGTSLDNTFLTINGSHKTTDGWRAWNRFESSQASLKAGHLFDDGSTLQGTFSWTDADIELPGTLNRAEFKDDPFQRTSEPFRHNGRYSTIYTANLKLEKKLGDWQFKPLAYYQNWRHLHPVPGLINDGGSDIFGLDLQGNRQHKLFGIPAELTTGIAGQMDDGDGEKYIYRDLATQFSPFPPPGTEKILYSLSDEKGEKAEENEERITKWGIYVQESLRPDERWLIDLGVRYDQVRFDLDTTMYQEFVWGADMYRSFDPPQNLETTETFDYLSPRIGVVYRLNEVFNLYGNIATGFQTPQASELQENNDLDPARTFNYEGGVKARFQKGHNFNLTVFYQEVKDEIVQTLLADNQVAYSNAGQTNKWGVEFDARLQIRQGLILGGTYTYSDFEFEEFDEPVYVYNPVARRTEVVVFDRSGNQLPYIPEHQYSLYLSYRHAKGFKARIDTASWERYWVDNANSERYSGYDFLTSLMVGWEKGPWDFSIDVNNLFDKKYAMEVTKSGDDLRYRPGAPRTFFAKVSYNF